MLSLRPLNDQLTRFSPRDVFVELTRYAHGLVAWFVFCIALAIAYILVTPPEFYAASNVILEPRSSLSAAQGVDPSLLQVNLDNSQIESQIQIVRSERVLRFVFQALNLQDDPEFGTKLPIANPTPEQVKRHDAIAFATFADRVSVRRVGQSLVLEIGFRSRSGTKAAGIANSVTAAFIRDQIEARSLFMQRNNEWLQGRIDEIKSQQLAIEGAVRTGVLPDRQFSASDARIISSASEPLSKSYPQSKLILLLAAALALLTGLGAASVLHTLDRTLRASRHIQRDLGLTCIGIVPKASEKRVAGRSGGLRALVRLPFRLPSLLGRAIRSLWPFRKASRSAPLGDYVAYSTTRAGTLSPFAESLRAVRTAVMGREQHAGPRLIGVVSCLPGEGKSTIASNLAHLFAAAGQNTMLIDADLRNNALSRHFASEARYGLSDVLPDGSRQVAAVAVDLVPQLDFVAATGAGRTADVNLFIGSAVMRDQLRALKAYDWVVVDLPAMSLSSDVKALAPLLDAVVFVVEAGRATSDDVTEALETLQQANGKVMGAILNKVPRRDWPVLLRRPQA